ncbi:MAG: hypothetical protein QUV07_00435 [Cyanobium sp. CZS 25K]|nr:hypothetical protein [Cyanobium sp. CZS25K]
MTQTALERWLERDGDDVRMALGPDGAGQLRAGQALWGEDGERQGLRLINNLLDRVAALLGGCPLLGGPGHRSAHRTHHPARRRPSRQLP